MKQPLPIFVEFHEETSAYLCGYLHSESAFSIFQVSIECGLSEMMNTQAMGGIVSKVVPRVDKWFPDLPELEAIFPAGTIDHSAKPIYPEVCFSMNFRSPLFDKICRQHSYLGLC